MNINLILKRPEQEHRSGYLAGKKRKVGEKKTYSMNTNFKNKCNIILHCTSKITKENFLLVLRIKNPSLKIRGFESHRHTLLGFPILSLIFSILLSTVLFPFTSSIRFCFSFTLLFY